MRKIQNFFSLLLVFTLFSCSSDDESSPAENQLPITSSVFKMVSVGNAHTIAIKTNGTLWAWGHNATGVLGNGTTTSSRMPIQIGNANDWLYIDAGNYFNLAIKNNGTLWAWGDNIYGNLGDNTTIQRNTPIQIGVATNWTKVSAGNNFSLAINSNGDLYGWGANNAFQIGGTAASRSTPTLINNNNYIDASAGNDHSYALTSSGVLYSFGANLFGELGLGNNGLGTNRQNPTLVPSTVQWRSISAGLSNTGIGIKTDGSLWVWGYNLDGYLGLGHTNVTNIPTRVGTATDWKKAVAGFNTFLATKNNNTLWTWGLNSRGQLGNSATTNLLSPTQIGTSSNWEFLTQTSNLHSFAIQADGSLWGSGANQAGQLGDNTNADKNSFTRIN